MCRFNFSDHVCHLVTNHRVINKAFAKSLSLVCVLRDGIGCELYVFSLLLPGQSRSYHDGILKAHTGETVSLNDNTHTLSVEVAISMDVNS